MNFSDWLNKQIRDRDWNQSELARRANLSRQAVSHLLSGRSKTPDNETIRKIANALDLSLDTVLASTDIFPTEKNQDAWVTETTRQLSQLSPEYREIAETIIRSLRDKERKK